MKKYTHQELKDILNQRGLKSTHQRIVIYNTLMNTDAHPTADEVHGAIKTEYPSITLATVYNTLDTFAEYGLANKVMSNDGYMRYDGNMDQHSHIYLTNTHEIMDYEDEELSQLLQDYFRKKDVKNLKINDIKVQINGEKINPNNNVSIK